MHSRDHSESTPANRAERGSCATTAASDRYAAQLVFQSGNVLIDL